MYSHIYSLILNSINLNEIDYKLFFIRLLYPSFYFDIYEQIVNNEIEEEELKKIINKIPEYETLIKKTYVYIKNNNFLPDIEWIKKM